jgi:single-stranded-DNA-specific exonuclease
MKRWQIAKPAPKKFIEGFPEYHPITLQLLYNRGIKSEKEIEKFLNPDWDRDLYEPFLMKGMKEAVSRIKKALKKKEKVAIFGHFDADGIAATALLYLVLSKLGLKSMPYIPVRKEGYGLNKERIFQLKKEDVDLIITVDTGISSFFEIELAKKLKMDLIVTDHHEIPKILPKAEAILNPKQKNCSYPFKELSGTGVVFKLAQALSLSFSSSLLPCSYLKWFVDLVALGTICDVVPLLDENRLFAKFGLIVLNKTRRIGLQKLYQVAQLKPNAIDPYTVSFIIGPRLNAPGRMDHANASFFLLTTKEPEKAEELAKMLDNYNRQRQAILEKAVEEAKVEVLEKNLLDHKLILIGKQEWHSGIIGLIASKLVEEYGRPALVLQVGEKISKGSARSIDAFHITEILSNLKEYLINFGGHKKAAGFSVLTEKIEELKDKLRDLAEERLTEEDVIPSLKVEAKIDPKEINWDLWRELEKFEPTGFGNSRPLFLAENVRVENVRTVGNEGNHLKMKLYGLDGIYFGAGKLSSSIFPSDIIDIVFQIAVDEWQNQRKLVLKIVDLRKARTHHIKKILNSNF